MRPYVEEVHTNVKAGAKVALGRKTLIVGPNRKGKSTIVNGVELATTGRASDVAGRETLAQDAELWTLAPPGAETVFARATVGGDSAQWTLAKGKRALRHGPTVAFPLREVQSELTGSPERARKWLLAKLSTSTPFEAVLAMLPATLHARVRTLAGDSVAGLPTALSTAKERARDEKRRAEALRASAKTAAAAIAAAPAASVSPPGVLEGAVAASTLAQRVEAARQRVEAAEAALKATPAPDGAFAAAAAGIVTVLRQHVAAGGKKCGVCAHDFVGDDAKKRLATIEAALGSHYAIVAKRNSAQATLQSAIASHEAEKAALHAVEQATKPAAPAPLVDPRWAEVQRQEAEALGAERTAAEWNEIVATLSTVIGRLVEQARAGFEQSVQRFMPAGMTFGLDLADGEREVTRYGLREAIGVEGRNEPGYFLRSALSGAEWAIVTTAIACAVAPATGPVVIVPEERAFDPVTLGDALTAFGKADAQVIVTSPIAPAEIGPEWRVVTVGEIAVKAPAASPRPEPDDGVDAGPLFDALDGVTVGDDEDDDAGAAPVDAEGIPREPIDPPIVCICPPRAKKMNPECPVGIRFAEHKPKSKIVGGALVEPEKRGRGRPRKARESSNGLDPHPPATPPSSGSGGGGFDPFM